MEPNSFCQRPLQSPPWAARRREGKKDILFLQGWVFRGWAGQTGQICKKSQKGLYFYVNCFLNVTALIAVIVLLLETVVWAPGCFLIKWAAGREGLGGG